MGLLSSVGVNVDLRRKGPWLWRMVDPDCGYSTFNIEIIGRHFIQSSTMNPLGVVYAKIDGIVMSSFNMSVWPSDCDKSHILALNEKHESS